MQKNSFFIILGITSLLFICARCRFDSGSVRLKQGSINTVQTREASYFNKVELDGDFTVYLKNDTICSISVEGEEDLLNIVLTEIKDSTLKIGYMNNDLDQEGKSVIVNINVVNLEEIYGKNSLSINTSDVFQFNHLNMNFQGAVNINFELNGNFLNGSFTGASSVNLKGKTDSIRFDIPGACRLNAFELETKKTDLNLAGAGKAEINVSEQLSVNMTGACSVSYKGNPSCVYSNITGIGRLKKVD